MLSLFLDFLMRQSLANPSEVEAYEVRSRQKMKLPERYCLFFRALKTPEQNAIFILWLGYPRKEGDKKDCYAAFSRRENRGDCPETLDDLLFLSED